MATLSHTPRGHRGGGSQEVHRYPTLAERIALTLSQEHAEHCRPHDRSKPSAPRRFSWEEEG